MLTCTIESVSFTAVFFGDAFIVYAAAEKCKRKFLLPWD